MSPEERQLLSELFDRVRGQANAPRDRDAETFIADAVRAQPYAPYLLAQSVIVQEHALRAADQKLQELQAEVAQLQQQAQSAAAPQASGGFLGGLFGGGRQAPPPPPQPQAQPNPWGAAPQQQYAPPPPQPGSFAGPSPSPWGGPQQPSQAGGFLRNAMGAAAGVAGGVLLADSIRGLFSGGGHGGGLFGGGMGGQGPGGGETIVNNYYENPSDDQNQAGFDSSDNSGQDDADYSGDDDYSGGDDFSSDV